MRGIYIFTQLKYLFFITLLMSVIFMQILLQPLIGDAAHFLMFFTAVFVSSWYGGVQDGLLATVLLTIFSFIRLTSELSLTQIEIQEQNIRIFLFFTEGLFIGALIYQFQLTRKQKETLLQKAQDQFDIALKNSKICIHIDDELLPVESVQS